MNRIYYGASESEYQSFNSDYSILVIVTSVVALVNTSSGQLSHTTIDLNSQQVISQQENTASETTKIRKIILKYHTTMLK